MLANLTVNCAAKALVVTLNRAVVHRVFTVLEKARIRDPEAPNMFNNASSLLHVSRFTFLQ